MCNCIMKGELGVDVFDREEGTVGTVLFSASLSQCSTVICVAF